MIGTSWCITTWHYHNLPNPLIKVLKKISPLQNRYLGQILWDLFNAFFYLNLPVPCSSSYTYLKYTVVLYLE